MLNIIKFVKRVSNQKAPENCTIEKAFLFRMQWKYLRSEWAQVKAAV